MPTCTLEDCPVAKDGRCLEGRGTECPNLLLDATAPPTTTEVLDIAGANASPSVTFESLPGRVPLEVAEARSFARRGPCVVIAMVGMPECGKTSLLARLHQMFQAGSVAGFDFAGSQSLPHFEELNWLATIESGVDRPRMLRSSSQFDNSFLHLRVRSVADQIQVELLLNDITGDTFEKAVASQQQCDALVSLARADHLVILVDGEALATPSLRHHHIAQSRDFLQRVQQGGQCGGHTALHIVTSKLDRLRGHEAVADQMEAEFRERSSGLGSLNFWRLAARPMDGSLPTSDRIGDLLAFWVGITHRYPRPNPTSIPRHFWARDFCRYGS